VSDRTDTARPRAPRSTRQDPEIEARAAAASPLLLHSIDAFGEIPVGVLDIVAPRRIVEIGGEGATFTRTLVRWADAHDAAVLCVDPAPSEALRRLAAETRLELVEGYSPEALAGIEPCDVYVVDGDHNHATVRGELEALPEGALAILHDVGWPCGRRDFYYGPERFDGTRPHSFSRGVVLDSGELAEGDGLSGNGAMAIAEEAGGEGNGVLTAVEDFMAAHDGYEFALVPCVYGLGFLYASGAEWADRLREFLAPYDGSALLGTLEANRLKLFFHVLHLQGELERRGARYERQIAEYERRIAKLSGEDLHKRAEGQEG